jgi:hypothetical protein
MRNFIQNLIDFIKNIFLKDSPESSKRFFGGIGFISSIVFIGVFDHSLISTLLYVSATLIGLGIVDGVVNKMK